MQRQTKKLLGIFSGIPMDQRSRVYHDMVATKLVQAYADDDGTCGCPLTVAASAVANEPVRVLSEINYREPIIAQRLGITEEDVKSFVRIWDRLSLVDRLAFKLEVFRELLRLSFLDAIASLTIRGLAPVRLIVRHAHIL